MPDVVGRLRPPRIAGAPASPALGELYYDTGTNALYWWNGTSWIAASGGTPPNDEIGYDQLTTTITIASTNLATPTTILAGSAHTFDGSPVIAEFFAPIVQTSAAASTVTLALMESGANIAVLTVVQDPAATAMRVPVLARYRFTPSAGAHTYGVSAVASVITGSPFVGAGAGGNNVNVPAYLRFTRATS